MDTRTGISFGISFFLVVLAAVALHRPEPSAPKPVAQTAKPVEAVPIPRDTIAPTPPEPTPGHPWPAPSVPATPESKVDNAVRPAEPIAVAPTSGSVVRKVARPANPRRPRSAFTTVAKGESLADVAYRVYGTEEAKRSLWLANRDHLDQPDSPLTAGMALRTP
jgi:hypothetical protein